MGEETLNLMTLAVGRGVPEMLEGFLRATDNVGVRTFFNAGVVFELCGMDELCFDSVATQRLC